MSRSGVGAVRALRVLLLVLLLGGVAAVAGLYVLGRIGREDPSKLIDQASRERGGYAVEGGSIRQTATLGDRVLYEIRGDTFREGEEGAVLLEGVGIMMARDEGAYRLEGDRATYDPNTKDARLEGSVLLEGPDGLVLRTDWLELRQAGTVVVATNGSEFELGDRFVGQAKNLFLDLEQDELLLNGGVRLATREGGGSPPLVLRGRMISYDRVERKVLARGNVRLTRPDGRLESMRLNIDFDADTDDVRVVRATGRVTGWWTMSERTMSERTMSERPAARGGRAGRPASAAADDAATSADDLEAAEAPARRRYDLSGMKLVLLLTPGEQRPERIDLQGFRQAPALLTSIDAQAAQRRLSAADLAAGLDRGVLSWVNAVGDAELVEIDPAGAVTRRAEAARSEALFDAQGALVRIQLHRDVVIEEAAIRAVADRADIDDRQSRTELTADDRVEVTNPQGTLLAPAVTYSHESKLTTAEGGVRATLRSQDGDLLGPLGSGGSDAPVRVESEEALLRDDGDFVFSGGARAWQEQTRLTASQIRGNQQDQSLAASGSVETHWRAAPAAGAQPAATGEATEPVHITSEHLSYAGGEQAQLVYEGDVVVRQAGRVLRCQHLTVALDPEGQAETMDCRESAVLEDPAMSREVRGVRALYFPKLGEVVVSPPLELIEPKRTIASPQRLWYRLEDGQFELGPQAPDPGRSSP